MSEVVVQLLNRFANVSMKMNDPLQTLYQIMSGRQPAAATVSFKGTSVVCVLCIFISIMFLNANLTM